MPIVWNEPLSFLQRFTENVLYAYLLDRADECADPVMRMQVCKFLDSYSHLFSCIDADVLFFFLQYVAAFAASSISSTVERLSKPFNPLLGETFEFAQLV